MTTYLFPGQGSQHKGMGAKLFDVYPELLGCADEILGYSIKDLCLNNPDNKLHQTQYTQPALFVVNALYFQHRLEKTKALPNFAAGHSLGEYNALQAAGAVTFENGLRLVQKRGDLMSKVPPGGMAAVVGLDRNTVRELLDTTTLADIDIANINAPEQIVISGPRDRIHSCADVFEKKGARYIPLNVSGAFHSRYMRDAQQEFATFLKDFSFEGFLFPVIANATAREYEPGAISSTLAKQITHPVLWTDSMTYLTRLGQREFKELGDGQVLSNLLVKIQAHLADMPDNPIHPIPNPLNLNARIHQWNAAYPIGTTVYAANYDEPMQTRTEATVLFGHRAAIYLEGKKGYFSLEDITPVLHRKN